MTDLEYVIHNKTIEILAIRIRITNKGSVVCRELVDLV